MKKVLRFLGILLLILVVGFVILALASPKVVEIEKSTTINGAKPIVWNQMVMFKNWEHWNPWDARDSTMEVTVEGTDGSAGAVYSWVGENSGKGTITNRETGDNEMHYDMHFIEPMDSKSSGYVKIEDGEDGKVKATWGFRTEQGFLARGFSAIFGMKKMLERDFEEGLGMLKEYVESGKAGPTYDIHETTFPTTKFATIRETVKFNEMDQFFGPAYEKLGKAAGDKITGNAYGIYYSWDEENGQSDCAAAFPVSGDVKGMTMQDIPESKAYMMKYTGPYSGLYGAHMAMNEHIQDKGVKDVLVLEEYITMPQQEPDTNKYVTNIYYLVK